VRLNTDEEDMTQRYMGEGNPTYHVVSVKKHGNFSQGKSGQIGSYIPWIPFQRIGT
jgi:hypothetical protein